MKHMHSREELYRFLWEHASPTTGVIQLKQGEIAEKFGISYQRLSIVMSEFIDMGLVEKTRHMFQVRYDPDKIPWDGKYLELRKRYIRSKNASKNKESS